MTISEKAQTSVYVPIVKIDAEHRMVYGFAVVSTDEGGAKHFDTQGDHVGIDTVRKAWHAFVKGKRTGGLNHDSALDGGTVVEGLVIDTDVKNALGMAPDAPEGLFIGYHATGDKAWNGVKKGLIRGFSVGGRGRRKKVD